MIYRGHVKDGVIVLDDPAELPEGAIVRINVVPDVPKPIADVASPDAEGDPKEREIDPMFRIFELAVDAGPPDLGRNIDHYLYGHPKEEDEDDE